MAVPSGGPQALSAEPLQFARSRPALVALLWVQGIYYLITGVWPLVSIRTFQLVTGPKTDHLVTGKEGDHWLVMTVGVLITSIALALLLSAWRKEVSPAIALLAVGSAASLTLIDCTYVARQVIAKIYLADAAVELVLIALWAAFYLSPPRRGVG